MKKESKYFLSIIAIFLATISVMFGLLGKYSFSTAGHFLEVCKQAASVFYTSFFHHAGLAIIAVTTVAIITLVLKTIFSLIKTQNKLNSILRLKIEQIPPKLKTVLKSTGIASEKVIVIRARKDIALSCGLFSPKIVTSTSLIKKLTANELESVVWHEYYHLKNIHPLIVVAGEIISSTLFFLPVVRELVVKMRVVLEKEADRFVIEKQKTSNNLNLALSKIGISGNSSFYPTFSGLNGYGSLLPKRIDHQIRKSSIGLSMAVFALGVVLFLFPPETSAENSLKSGTGELVCGENQCATHCVTAKSASSSLFRETSQSGLISQSKLR